MRASICSIPRAGAEIAQERSDQMRVEMVAVADHKGEIGGASGARPSRANARLYEEGVGGERERRARCDAARVE